VKLGAEIFYPGQCHAAEKPGCHPLARAGCLAAFLAGGWRPIDLIGRFGKMRANVRSFLNNFQRKLSKMMLAGHLGSSVYEGVAKDFAGLDRSLNRLLAYLDELSGSPETI
jgi:hypothetical protein